MSVDWESILKRAQANCLCVAGFTDQHHFLTGIISQFESGDRGQSLLADSRKAKRELQTLLHPEMLGRTFQVLALAKNVGREGDPLAGFKFARDRALAR
jgi:SAM-dependent MidA family methyltransferase